MRNLKILGFALMSITLGSLAAFPNSVNQAIEDNDARIIVKFNLSPRDYTKEQIVAYQNQAIASIRGLVAPRAEVVDRYTNLINGVVLNVPASKVNVLRELSFVADVDYDTLHHIEQGDGGITIQSGAEGGAELEDNISAETMNVPDNTKKGEGILVGILDSGFLLNHYDETAAQYYTHETYSPLDAQLKTKINSAAEVDAIVATPGFHGEAKTVDSLYFNNKVPFYFDYGGTAATYDDYANNANVVMDNDVFSKLSDHGLHVSSLAAGNGPTLKGIAPNAQLALFKVFTEFYASAEDKKEGRSDSSGAFDSAVIKALEDAAALKCDVLNMSFGSDLNDFDQDSIVGVLLDELRENGIWSNYAAGNSGKGSFSATSYGGWTGDMVDTGITSDSANEESVMTVGANQADREYYKQAIEINGRYVSYTDQVISSSDTTFTPQRYLTDFVTPASTKDWIKVPNFGEAKDYSGINVTDKVAVVDRGTNTFADKVVQAVNKGAKAVCIINNTTEGLRMNFGENGDGSPITPAVPVVLIEYGDRDAFNAGSGQMSLISNVYVNNVTAHQMASFSSDGPTYDYRIKPEITAPGQGIKGAVSENANGEVVGNATNTYDYWSGTSMAAPNYTGSLALLLSEHTTEQAGKLVIDPDYLKSVNARTMSTATQMTDRFGVESSVRMQGAGMVNVNAALQSEVYFEGAVNSGKAKIELKNNADIASGEINLSFVAHNEGAAKSYNAKIKVFRPTVFHFQRLDTSKEDPSINNAELKAVTNTLIAEVNAVVNVPAGDSTIDLDTISLDAATKQYIEEHFDGACPIEGYVILTNDQDPKLSIPFLGFYGDVSSALAIEPFNFEKEPGKTYPSALVNNVMKVMGFDKGDFSSDMAVGYMAPNEEDSTLSLGNWFYNKGDVTSIVGDKNANFYRMDADKKADGGHTLYAQSSEEMNTIFITQFVMRSIQTNDLTITRKANSQVMVRDHMFDTLWGDDNNYALAKSFCLEDYLSDGIVGHRAYTILALFNQESKVAFPEGEYEIKFDYVLVDGSHQVKTYDLVIDNSSPKIASMVKMGDSMRVRFSGAAMKTVQISVNVYKVKKDALGYYVDLPSSEVKTGRIIFSGTSYDGRVITAMAYFEDPDGIVVTNDTFLNTFHYSVTKTVSGSTLSYTIAYRRGSNSTKLEGDTYISLTIPEGYDPHKVTVIDYDKLNAPKEVAYTVSNSAIRFLTIKSRFDVILGDTLALNSLEVTAPNRTTFAVGEELDLSGLLVAGKYSDNSRKEIVNYSLSEVDMSTPGTKEITVGYGNKNAKFSINVIEEALSVLVIKSLPIKTTYLVNETISLAGLVVTSITNTDKVVEVNEYTVSSVDTSTPGSKVVTINYQDLSVSFVVTIIEQGGPVNPNPVVTSSSSQPPSSSRTSSSSAPVSSEVSSSSNGSSGSSTGPNTNRTGCGGSITMSLSLIAMTAILGIGYMVIKSKSKKETD